MHLHLQISEKREEREQPSGCILPPTLRQIARVRLHLRAHALCIVSVWLPACVCIVVCFYVCIGVCVYFSTVFCVCLVCVFLMGKKGRGDQPAARGNIGVVCLLVVCVLLGLLVFVFECVLVYAFECVFGLFFAFWCGFWCD